MDQLPDDNDIITWQRSFPIYANIMSFLLVEDVCLSRRVCRSFKEFSDWSPLWEKLIVRDFPQYASIDKNMPHENNNNNNNNSNNNQIKSAANGNDDDDDDVEVALAAPKNVKKTTVPHIPPNLASLVRSPPFRAQFLVDFGDIFFNQGRSAYSFVALIHRFPCMMTDIMNRSRKDKDFDIPVPHTWRHSVAFEINGFVEPIFACATFDEPNRSELAKNNNATNNTNNNNNNANNNSNADTDADQKNRENENSQGKLSSRLEFLRSVTLERKIGKTFLSHHKAKDQQILSAIGRLGFTEETNNYDHRGNLIRTRGRGRGGRGRGGPGRGRGFGAMINNNNDNDDDAEDANGSSPDDNDDAGNDDEHKRERKKNTNQNKIKSTNIRLISQKLKDTPLMLLADLLYLVPQFYKSEIHEWRANHLEMALENRGSDIYDARPNDGRRNWNGTESRNSFVAITLLILFFLFASPISGLLQRFHYGADVWDNYFYRAFSPANSTLPETATSTKFAALAPFVRLEEYPTYENYRKIRLVDSLMGLVPEQTPDYGKVSNFSWWEYFQEGTRKRFESKNENETGDLNETTSPSNSSTDSNNNLVPSDKPSKSWADVSAAIFGFIVKFVSLLVAPMMLTITPDINVKTDVQEWWNYGYQNVSSSNEDVGFMKSLVSLNPSVAPVNYGAVFPNFVFSIVYFPFSLISSAVLWFQSFFVEPADDFVGSQIALGWCPKYPVFSSPTFMHPPLFLYSMLSMSDERALFSSANYFEDTSQFTTGFICYNPKSLKNYLRVPPLTRVAHRCPREIVEQPEKEASEESKPASWFSIPIAIIDPILSFVVVNVPGTIGLFILIHSLPVLVAVFFSAAICELLINYTHKRNKLLPRPKIHGHYGIDRDIHWFTVIPLFMSQYAPIFFEAGAWCFGVARDVFAFVFGLLGMTAATIVTTAMTLVNVIGGATSDSNNNTFSNATDNESCTNNNTNVSLSTPTVGNYYTPHFVMHLWVILPFYLIMVGGFQIFHQMEQVWRTVGGLLDDVTCVKMAQRKDFPATGDNDNDNNNSPSSSNKNHALHTSADGLLTFAKFKILSSGDDDLWSWDEGKFKIPHFQNLISMCFAASRRFYCIPTTSDVKESKNAEEEDEHHWLNEVLPDRMLASAKQRFLQSKLLRQKSHRNEKRNKKRDTKSNANNKENNENEADKTDAAKQSLSSTEKKPTLAKKSPSFALLSSSSKRKIPVDVLNLRMKRIWLVAFFLSHLLQFVFVFAMWCSNLSVVWVFFSPIIITELLSQFGKNWECSSNRYAVKFVNLFEKVLDFCFGV